MDSRLKLTLPIEEIEASALEQIEAALKLPYLKLLAIMPDVHTGYALPIGAVALLEDHVWPAAVGYDIGCGMCHVNTGMKRSELPDLKELFKHLSDEIPVGFHELKTPATDAPICQRITLCRADRRCHVPRSKTAWHSRQRQPFHRNRGKQGRHRRYHRPFRLTTFRLASWRLLHAPDKRAGTTQK